MKQLVGFREQFANAQMIYLQTLKNTGITLWQFTEAETLELEDTPFGLGAPPSPLLLPPSPLPPPPFSPDLRKVVKVEEEEVVQEEGVADGEKRGHGRDDFNPATGKTGKTIRRGREERSRKGRFQSQSGFCEMFPCSLRSLLSVPHQRL
ncbi:hypothetical protein NE237_029853 [Protea cynaroides]|uniref:DUF630 domain-containing protein n=1 Tax=Protea cynaroides TaxID=273540 RepID=A0A9Q0GTZ1_9MAGN|nr:hypothetical protein NE237_029853 [Protea cynaroides]